MDRNSQDKSVTDTSIYRYSPSAFRYQAFKIISSSKSTPSFHVMLKVEYFSIPARKILINQLST